SRTSSRGRPSRRCGAGSMASTRRRTISSVAAVSSRGRPEPSPPAMRLAYVLDRPELCGGVKVVFQHAQILHARGHQVTILAAGGRPSWIRFDGDFVDTRAGSPALPPQDLVVATYWTTVDVAERLDRGPVAHFCQGYEGDLPHLEPVRGQ